MPTLAPSFPSYPYIGLNFPHYCLLNSAYAKSQQRKHCRGDEARVEGLAWW